MAPHPNPYYCGHDMKHDLKAISHCGHDLKKHDILVFYLCQRSGTDEKPKILKYLNGFDDC
jgi:hypothetical protein